METNGRWNAQRSNACFRLGDAPDSPPPPPSAQPPTDNIELESFACAHVRAMRYSSLRLGSVDGRRRSHVASRPLAIPSETTSGDDDEPPPLVQSTEVAAATGTSVHNIHIPIHVIHVGTPRIGRKLTFCAVVALRLGRVFLPAFQADLFAVRAADVVAELVVSRPAQGVAILAVVMSGADHAIVVFQPRVGLLVHASGPRVTGVELVLSGQSAHQGLFCND